MSQEMSTQRKLLPWALFAAVLPWTTWIHEGWRELWLTDASMSAIALAILIPAFRKPVWPNPAILYNLDRRLGFGNGMMVVGAACLLAGLFADSMLTANLGAIAVWTGAVQRMTVIDWDARARQAADQVAQPA